MVARFEEENNDVSADTAATELEQAQAVNSSTTMAITVGRRSLPVATVADRCDEPFGVQPRLSTSNLISRRCSW